jgi:CO/xanthine dehydrogenase FAD-binding subunit
VIGNVAALERPRSLADLLAILARVKPPRYLLAGGTDLLVQAKDGHLKDGTYIDIWALQKELRYAKENDAEIELGALFTMTDGETSPLLKKWAPALVVACEGVGAVQIRNRATFGGNCANASPAADSVPALYSVGASIQLASQKRGVRSMPIEKFFLGVRKTVLEPDEAIVSFKIPKVEGARGSWLRLGQRQAQTISKVSVSATATFKPDGAVASLRIAFGAVAPTVVRTPRTEAYLTGKTLDEATLRAAQDRVVEEVSPITDIRSTAEYRREGAGFLLARALRAIRP